MKEISGTLKLPIEDLNRLLTSKEVDSANLALSSRDVSILWNFLELLLLKLEGSSRQDLQPCVFFANFTAV